MMPNSDTLDAWLAELEAERLVGPSKEALAAELGAWLALAAPAVAGDEPSKHELFKLVALHARSLGYEDKPASFTVLRAALLDPAIRAAKGAISKEEQGLVRSLIRVAADAHALGQAERLTAKHHHEIRDFSPVLRVGGDTVVAFMLGPMSPGIIDAIAGRLLRECSISGAKVAVLDVFGAAADDDRFHRTIAEVVASEQGKKLTLVLAGLRDPAGTKAALAAVGTDLSRVRLVESVSQYFSERRL